MRTSGQNGVWLAVCTLGVAGLLLGCDADAGTKPPSEFCKAVDSLTASVTQINQTSLSKNTIDAAETSLSTIMKGVENLGAVAQPEFDDEVDAATAAASDLGKTVSAAVDQPNPANIGDARSAMGELTTAVQDLSKSTSQSC